METAKLALEIDGRLCIRPLLRTPGGELSPVAGGGAGKPAFHAWLGGALIDNFRVDWGKVNSGDFSDAAGGGKKLTLTALADQYGQAFYPSLKVEMQVMLYFYDKLPQLVAGEAVFTNRGPQALSIDRLVGHCYRLDRRLLDPGQPSWSFASYMGAARRWGESYSLIWTDAATDRENFMGLDPARPAAGEGGGTPLVDLWTPQCGLAGASAETCPQWINLPVRTGKDGLVEVSVCQEPQARFGQKTVLAPGESCSTIRSAVILHRLDFHDALRGYADLLRTRGVNIPLDSPPACYEPYWKSWGFGLDFTLEQIYGALEEIKSFGIKMAMLDDGWFTWYGDWKPTCAKGKFPGGEPDMRKFVKRLKAAGLKTSLWWYPQGVSPESDLAREHPEWLITNQDGTLPRCQRKLYYLCPECPEAVAHVVGLVEKILGDWDYDGLYIDTTGLIAVPPCFNPAHKHDSPLDSFQRQAGLFKAIYERAQALKPGCPLEMCICSLPHDPFKMPYYNVANASDPVNLPMVRRRIKVEKAFRGPSFCVGDCYQIPIHEWEEWSVPESFESAVGTGAQATTLYSALTESQREKWRRWFGIYNALGLSSGEYLNLYDIAFDKPEAHVVRKNGSLYYGFFVERWPRNKPLALRGLERVKSYRVTEYASGRELGTISGSQPEIRCAFAGSLLLKAEPLK